MSGLSLSMARISQVLEHEECMSAADVSTDEGMK